MPTPKTPPKGGNALIKKLGPFAAWQWGLIAIGGGLLGWYLLKQFGGAAQGAQGANTPNSGLGLAIDPTTGLPYAVEGLVPSGGLAGSQPVQQPPPNTPTTATPAPTWWQGIPGATVVANGIRYEPLTGTKLSEAQTAQLFRIDPVAFSNIPGATSLFSGKQPAMTIPFSALPGGGGSVTPGTSSGNMPARYINVAQWPQPFSSLADIAAREQTSVSALRALNPQITNPNLIYAGERIRIA